MAEAEEQREPKRMSLRERSRQWFLTIGTALALLATIIGFLSDSLGVVEFIQSRSEQISTPAPTATVSLVGVATPNLPQALVQLQTEAITPTSALPVATPTSTPLPVVAAADERLLLVAQFSNFTVDANYNVAGRIHEALAAQVEAAQLADTRVAVWPDVLTDASSAASVRAYTGATIVIWGEYDSGRVRVRFELEEGGGDVEWQRLLGAPTELSTTINLDVPRETQALAMMVLGRVYRNAGDLAGARAAFAQALAQQPSHEDTVATLTFYLAILDAAATPPDLDRAIDGYSKVSEMRPDWVNARYNRGIAYLTRYWISAAPADVDAAIADFSWTLEAKSNYAEALVNRAIALYARNGAGDMESALADLNDAIRFDPTSHRAFYNRGLVYVRLEQRARWEADLNHSLELAPDYWVANHALCWSYALDGLPEAAMPHCDIAREHDSSGSTLDGRGLALAQLGRLENALTDLTAYVAWLDTQPEAWAELNNRAVYAEIVEGLRAGENRVTAEVLARLR